MRLPWLTIGLAALAVGEFLAAGPAAPVLVHDRDAILAGEAWRAVTGHFVHADTRHLAINVAALLLLGGLTEAASGAGRLAAAVVVGMAAVSATLLWAVPGLDLYCGLSGALNGVYVVAAADLWRLTRRKRFLAAIAADAGKIGWEWSTGATLLSASAWPAASEAHLAGLIGGLLMAAHSAALGVLISKPARLVRPTPPLAEMVFAPHRHASLTGIRSWTHKP